MVSPRLLSLTSRYQLGLLALLCLFGLWLWPMKLTAIGGGGLLMALNFWLLRYMMNKAFGGDSPKVIWALALASKTVAMLVLISVLMLVAEMDALGVALGLSTLFVGIGLAATHQALSSASVPAPDAAPLG